MCVGKTGLRHIHLIALREESLIEIIYRWVDMNLIEKSFDQSVNVKNLVVMEKPSIKCLVINFGCTMVY